MLVSAVIADGPPRRALELINDGGFALVVPALALAELRRVLIEQLGLDPPGVREIVALLEELADVVVDTPSKVDAVSGDPADDQIIAAAQAGGATLLISGDNQHVLPLGVVGELRIVRPQEFVAEQVGG